MEHDPDDFDENSDIKILFIERTKNFMIAEADQKGERQDDKINWKEEDLWVKCDQKWDGEKQDVV